MEKEPRLFSSPERQKAIKFSIVFSSMTSTRPLTVRFCSECHNMLYPKEDRKDKRLLYACRNCEYQEEADHPCVYQYDYLKRGDTGNSQVVDLASDPTLPRSSHITCPKCSYKEAVFFQSRGMRERDAAMKLAFVCCSCNHQWTDNNND